MGHCRDAQEAARDVAARAGELSNEFPLARRTKEGYL